MGKPEVAPVSLPPVLGQVDDLHPRIARCIFIEDLRARVGSGIVDADDLYVGKRLRKHAVERGAQESLDAKDRDDD
jgi:hypothetical protein